MSERFTIEKGVPIPRRTPSRKGSTKYPFASMQIGESFFVPGRKEFSSASRWTREHPGWKFVVRKIEGGHRVWCTLRPSSVKIAELPVRNVVRMDR